MTMTDRIEELEAQKIMADGCIAQLKERLAEQEAEIERLRAAIENAPHDNRCDSHRLISAGSYAPCDCWKAAALKGEDNA